MVLASEKDLPLAYGRSPYGPIETIGQCVYLFTVPSGRVKIGIAFNPECRRRELQTGNPEPITFYGASLLANGYGADPREMERRLHAVLADYRQSGEWFAVSIDRVLIAWKYVWMTLARPRTIERWHRLKGIGHEI